MKYCILFAFALSLSQWISAQENKPKYSFYIGGSYGTSFSIGDFKDTDVTNEDAGFAKRGQKIELYGGKPIAEKVIFTGTLRYQRFKTETEDLIDEFKLQYPNMNFNGVSGSWQTYSLLLGGSYKLILGEKLDIYPRIGVGPLIVSNPELNVKSISTNPLAFNHSSETGVGLGYEFGIGTSTELGKHFVLLPTFTFSGGIITIPDVESNLSGTNEFKDYKPKIHSFNLGFSIAYRFY